MTTATMTKGVQGMLWNDSTGRQLELRLADATAYYQRRYGKRPTVVMLPVSEGAELDEWQGIAIQAGKIQKQHMIVGTWR